MEGVGFHGQGRQAVGAVDGACLHRHSWVDGAGRGVDENHRGLGIGQRGVPDHEVVVFVKGERDVVLHVEVDGDGVLLLDHTGSRPAEVRVTHTDAANHTTVIWPSPGAAEALPPGRSWRVPVCLEATAPGGAERFVVESRSGESTEDAVVVRGVSVVRPGPVRWVTAVPLEVLEEDHRLAGE